MRDRAALHVEHPLRLRRADAPDVAVDHRERCRMALQRACHLLHRASRPAARRANARHLEARATHLLYQ